MPTRAAARRSLRSSTKAALSSPPATPERRSDDAIKVEDETPSPSRDVKSVTTSFPTPATTKKTRSSQRSRKGTTIKPSEQDNVLPHGLGPAGDWDVANPQMQSPSKGNSTASTTADQLKTPKSTTPDSGAAEDDVNLKSHPVSPAKKRGSRKVNIKKEEPIDTKDVVPSQRNGKRKRNAVKVEADVTDSKRVKSESDSKTRKSKPDARNVREKKHPYGLTPGQTPFPEWEMPTPEACEEVNRLLSELHGEYKPPKEIPPPSLTVSGCGEVPDLLEALMRTLLSASTTANNANMAFAGLVKRFGHTTGSSHSKSLNWDAVRQASLAEVIEAIKRGGLANAKGKNIKSILDTVYAENLARRDALREEKKTGGTAPVVGAEHESKAGKEMEMARSTEADLLSLDHIFELATEDAMTEMTKLPGIGVKTASCVILFCMKRPSFAVDTHVWRHCKWLGWVPPSADRNKTFSHCEVRIPDHLKYSLHQLFLRHGKKCPRCRANTSAGTAEWEEANCPIEHLVNRTEGRKQIDASPRKGTSAPAKRKVSRPAPTSARGKKARRVKSTDESEESDISMSAHSDTEDSSGERSASEGSDQ